MSIYDHTVSLSTFQSISNTQLAAVSGIFIHVTDNHSASVDAATYFLDLTRGVSGMCFKHPGLIFLPQVVLNGFSSVQLSTHAMGNNNQMHLCVGNDNDVKATTIVRATPVSEMKKYRS